jgi:hypothetical protein
MIIGVPKEIKTQEYRVALTPAGADALVRAGHRVIVENSAGAESGFLNSDYQNPWPRNTSTSAPGLSFLPTCIWPRIEPSHWPS